MVLTTLSSGTLAFLGSVSRASSAALMAYSAHSVALDTGTCTKPQSQVSPKWCSMAISAAINTCSGVPNLYQSGSGHIDETPISVCNRPLLLI
jgi:hypothetical protein